jgi:hypothetical protein
MSNLAIYFRLEAHNQYEPSQATWLWLSPESKFEWLDAYWQDKNMLASVSSFPEFDLYVYWPSNKCRIYYGD